MSRSVRLANPAEHALSSRPLGARPALDLSSARPCEEDRGIAEHDVIRGGREGRERLRLLARVMRPSTLEQWARVGVQAGSACRDVGRGGDTAVECVLEETDRREILDGANRPPCQGPPSRAHPREPPPIAGTVPRPGRDRPSHVESFALTEEAGAWTRIGLTGS